MDLYGKILIRKGMDPKLAKQTSRKHVRYRHRKETRIAAYACRIWKQTGQQHFHEFLDWFDSSCPLFTFFPRAILLFAYARVIHGGAIHPKTGDSIENIEERALSLERELMGAIKYSRFSLYVERARSASRLYTFGESVGWERGLVLEYCTQHQTIDLPTSRYETAFDSGWMRVQAETYHRALLATT